MALTQNDLARRLATARERAGLTQQQAADALSLPRSAISQVENGNRAVSGLEMLAFARAYGVTVIDLLEGKTPQMELAALFRMDSVLEDADVQNVVAQAVQICRVIADLEDILNISKPLLSRRESLPPPATWKKAEDEGQQLAQRERERQDLSSLPIGDLQSRLVREGLGVAEHDLPEAISGVFLPSAGGRPFILLNSIHKGVRRRFSLAHEYCHALVDSTEKVIVSREEGRRDLREARANAFARHFLLPRDGILEFANERGTSPQQFHFVHVADLANRYDVSYDAAIVQLSAIGFITAAQEKEFKEKARQARGYAHGKHAQKSTEPVQATLKHVAYALILRAFEHQRISKRKALSLAIELGYAESSVSGTLDHLAARFQE